MDTFPLALEMMSTWMVTLAADLAIRTVQEPDAGSCEMPFANDLPVGLPLTVAMGLPPAHAAQLGELLASGREVKAYRYVINHELLGRRNYSLSAVPLLGKTGAVKGYQCSIADLTVTLDLADRQQRNEAELAAIIDATPTFLSVKDLEGRYVRLNTAARRLFAPWSADPVGRTASEIFPADLAAEFEIADEQVLMEEAAREFEQDLLIDGRLATLLTIKFPIFDGDGCVIGLGAMGVDITERKALESELNRLANYDLLTELPNRRLCRRLIDDALVLAQHTDTRMGIILCDLDEFRTLNNTLGNSAGDDILIEAAWRLKSSMPSACMVARLGGDEFCLVIPSVSAYTEIDDVMADIHRLFDEPMKVGDREVFVGVTLGAAVYPVDADGPEQLFQRADVALMNAKKTGVASVRFSDSMVHVAEKRTRIASLLRRAIEREELRLVYQPIVDAESGDTVVLEALLRWDSAELGPVGPDQFIPLAEETGLIRQIGAWCLANACADATAWNQSVERKIGVAVNVSPQQLFAEGFVEQVRETLAFAGLPASLLKIEITESSLVQDVDTCKRVLEDLAALGVTLALDDFGTGYSALSYLQQFKFHQLKLDQSFVRKMVPGESSAALTASIIAMAKSLGLKTVAEGVEHPAHWLELRTQGCDFCQGYHFSKPLPKEDLACLRTDT